MVLPTNFSLGLVVETSLMFQAACAASHNPARRPTRGSGLGAPWTCTSTARMDPPVDGAGALDAVDDDPDDIHAESAAATSESDAARA